MARLRLLLVLLLFIVSGASAQTRYLSSIEEARKVSEGIVASVAAGNYGGAIKDLRPLSVIAATDFDVFEAQFNSQQANLLRQFGSAAGYEFVREEKMGTRLIRYRYLVFHEKSAMHWLFIFYKSEKGWVISHFAFDGNAMTYFSGGGP
jgi:hypothetical protein